MVGSNDARTVDRAEEDIDEPSSRALSHLFFVLHADATELSGARILLEGTTRTLVGRADRVRVERRDDGGETTVRVWIPDRAMSQVHASIQRENGRWVVVDQGSRNGTFVGGVRSARKVLVDGDVIEMGSSFFVFRSELETPVDGPDDALAADMQHEHVGFRTLLPALAARCAVLKRLAPSELPILLLGPTGAGKEVVARAIHAASGRTGDFVAVNCGALPGALVEGLLFGHVKGAFSGAIRDERGLVRSAERGTLLLDEIGDLPLASQTALLRVLQEREVVPLGATRPVRVDVRVVAATHKPVDELASSGAFRLDLLARLNGFTHRLAPLSERKEDLGIIIASLVPELIGPSATKLVLQSPVVRALLRYDWPLNVRELRQCLGAASMLATNGRVTVADLPDGPLRDLARAPRQDDTTEEPLTAAEIARRDELLNHLQATRGNVTAVANAMGKAPFQIRRWLRRFGLDPNRFR